jgi:serine/threonine protein kinase
VFLTGNFGDVYRASMKKGTKQIEVAIKMVKNLEDKTDRVDFEREQMIMSTMVHHNIVKLYGLIHDEGRTIILRELHPQMSLLHMQTFHQLFWNFYLMVI